MSDESEIRASVTSVEEFPRSVSTNMSKRALLQYILDQIEVYQDPKSGRVICEPFQTVPSKDEYPDYHEVIDEPIALDVIQSKIYENAYSNENDLKDDFKLLAENAFTYNKKSSIVYKDAKLILDLVDDFIDQFHANQKLMEKARTVMSKLTSLTLESGESVESFFKELPPASNKQYYSSISFPISLYDISKKLEGNKYSGLGEFRSDLTMLVENAISFYGASSPQGLASGLIKDAISDLPTEEQDSAQSWDGLLPGPEVDSLPWKNETLKVGDFVYLVNDEDSETPLIGQIYNIYTNREDSSLGCRVSWYFRPSQTTHKLNTKFVSNEVLKCNHFENYSVDEILGRCLVLFIKDYIRGQPKNIDMKDVYVCESRYNMNAKTQAKIKNWPLCIPESVRQIEPDLDLYPAPLVLTRQPLEKNQNETQQQQPQERKRKKEISYAEPDDDDFEGNSSAAIKKQKLAALSEKSTSGYNFAAMGKTTKDLITRLHSQRPLYVVPSPSNISMLPKVIVDAFDTRGDGSIRWFTGPPLDVIPTRNQNSAAYLAWKKENSKKSPAKQTKKNGTLPPAANDLSMDVDEPVTDGTLALEQTLQALSEKIFKDVESLQKALSN